MRTHTVLALAFLAAAPLTAVTTACGSAWWQQFESNPEAQVQAFETGVQLVLSDAQIAWGIAQPFIPASSLQTVTTQYNNAVFAVNHAISVLNDAVTVAVNAQNATPSFTALMAAVTDAVTNVLAIIDQYTSTSIVLDGGAVASTSVAGKAPSSPALTEAHAGLTSLKAHYLPVTVVPPKAPAAH
jgi:hypothetical protein